MQPKNIPTTHAHGSRSQIIFEALGVLLAGIILGWAANSLSPRGLKLTRDYFPPGPPTAAAHLPPATSATNAPAEAITPLPTAIAFWQKNNGRQMIAGAQAERFFQSPLRLLGKVIFLDAREAQPYQAGHIPGAQPFDHYHPENTLNEVLERCDAADSVVVYCHGGDCEDSEFAANVLQENGVPSQKLFVYQGGITEWTENHWPVETGTRNSGLIKPGGKP